MMRTLTKSRFKLALDCVSKLHYTGKKDVYADESMDDPFREALAEGGFQVGELAKFEFCDDPYHPPITIETLDYERSLEETQKRLNSSKDVVIGEAAFQYGSLFVRTDLIVKSGKLIKVYEVKSKSFDGDHDENFVTKRGERKIKPGWAPYLYDIAFQKYVITKALQGQGYAVMAHLLLPDKSKVSTVEGLNQLFKIHKADGNGRAKVVVKSGLKKKDVGASIFKHICVDHEIDEIWNSFPVPTTYADGLSFVDFVSLCADMYEKDERLWSPIGKVCKGCQYVNSDPVQAHLRSGFNECWTHGTGYSEDKLKQNLVLELWAGLAGGKSLVQELIQQKIYLLKDANEAIIGSDNKLKEHPGLSPHERRTLQINAVKSGSTKSYFDKNGFMSEMKGWTYPLHMIDFETTMTALPYHKGRKPYEAVAFQFSHHIMERAGEIRHEGQFISFEPGVFPNYEFVRELKKQLEADKGSVFRYHNHENTYLNFIYQQLEEDIAPPKDKAELQEFIRSITKWTDAETRQMRGPRCMIDLYELVLRYYYSPHAKGSNSIKQILPAVINDSGFLKDKYGKPNYGRDKLVQSLNVPKHVWIDPAKGNDPYKTLPKIFDDLTDEQMSALVVDMKDVADGGAAMAAYNQLQFSEIPVDQREKVRDALLRYCELDTMAMVMIIEGWMNWKE